MVISEPAIKVYLELITNAIFAFTMTLLERDMFTSQEYEQVARITID
ncbi:MAG: hypothetical protein WCF90_10150 [Methanomicrobiales archaeon]